MARKHRASKKRPTTASASGPRGPRGAAGPRGRPGRNHTSELAVLAAQVDQLVKELQIQLTRIGQIQAQLDRFVAALKPQVAGHRANYRADKVES